MARLLRDPTAEGLRSANYTKSPGKKQPWTLKGEEEWVFSSVEAIVPEEPWGRCNAVLEERRRVRKPPAGKAIHLFGGVTCCTCGQKMYVPSNSPRYVCTRCRNKIPTADLEAVFAEQLKAFFLSPKEIVEYLASADETLKEKERVVQALVAEREKVTRSMEKLRDLYLAHDISKEGFGREYRPLEGRLHELEDELPRLQGEVATS